MNELYSITEIVMLFIAAGSIMFVAFLLLDYILDIIMERRKNGQTEKRQRS